MQPYFLPYIGYWQLMSYADIFVVYDDIKYTKKGWINRNRFLLNGKPELFTLPLSKAADHLDIRERELSEVITLEKDKILRRLEAAYRNAANFAEGRSLLVDIFSSSEINLFQFIYQSIDLVRTRLGISTQLVISSSLGVSRELKGQARVIATCKALGATEYINPIGGLDLYSGRKFRSEGLTLHFQRVQPFEYQQFEHEFVPSLSILDGFMFLGDQGVTKLLSRIDLLEATYS